MMDVEDDEVIKEIPIFCSTNLSDKLYLFEFPNECGETDFSRTPVISSSVKLSNREVKLELQLDIKGHNFDYDKGEKIGIEANGEPSKDPRKPHEKYFRRNMMDRIRLESRQALPDVSNHVVGILHKNELHVGQLKAMIHLRKSLAYLDQADKQAKNLAKESGLLEDSGEEEEEVKQVTVKFARQENDRYKQAKERSYNALSRKSAEEPWHHTEFHCYDTPLAMAERKRFHCNKAEHVTLEANVDAQLSLLALGYQEEAASEGNQAIEDLRRLPVADRVRNLMREVKLIRFSQLVQLLDLDSDLPNALKVVQQVCVLVQGNWVVRSDVLYKKKTLLAPEQMCRARDHVLYRLARREAVDRTSLVANANIAPDMVSEILADLAVFERGVGWRLALPPDTDFIERYPEIAERQQLQWEMKQKQGGETSKRDERKQRRKSSSCSEAEGGGGKRK